MRTQTLLLSALAITLSLALGAGSAAAATLFTSAAHTTRVSVGTTATLTSNAPWKWTLTTGLNDQTALINVCTSATMRVTVDGNVGGSVSATVTGSTYSDCSPFVISPTLPWRITVSGTGTATGATKRWPAAMDDFAFDLVGGHYGGSFLTGVTATEPVVATAPVCVNFDRATGFGGPLYADVRVDGNYCFTDGAAAWSLTS